MSDGKLITVSRRNAIELKRRLSFWKSIRVTKV
jgi:hypothetical protein